LKPADPPDGGLLFRPPALAAGDRRIRRNCDGHHSPGKPGQLREVIFNQGRLTMNTDTPSTSTKSDLNAKGMMPHYLAAITLTVGAAADAMALYLSPTYKSNLLLVFVLGYLAYVLGQAIEKRRAK
jgi:hypothetical protein